MRCGRGVIATHTLGGGCVGGFSFLGFLTGGFPLDLSLMLSLAELTLLTAPPPPMPLDGVELSADAVFSAYSSDFESVRSRALQMTLGRVEGAESVRQLVTHDRVWERRVHMHSAWVQKAARPNAYLRPSCWGPSAPAHSSPHPDPISSRACPPERRTNGAIVSVASSHLATQTCSDSKQQSAR